MILVFAGAGASKAANPNGYPTTEEFFERLPAQVTDDGLFNGLVQFIESRVEASVVDIEQWLWAAAETRSTFEMLADSGTPAGWLVNENRVGHMVGQNIDLQPGHNGD